MQFDTESDAAPDRLPLTTPHKHTRTEPGAATDVRTNPPAFADEPHHGAAGKTPHTGRAYNCRTA